MIDPPKRRKSSCCFPGADARGWGRGGVGAGNVQFYPTSLHFHDFLAKIKRCTEVCLVIISFNRFNRIYSSHIWGWRRGFAGGAGRGGRGGKYPNLSHFLAFS